MDKDYEKAVSLVKSVMISIFVSFFAIILVMGAYIVFFIPRGNANIETYKVTSEEGRTRTEGDYSFKIEEYENEEKEIAERVVLTKYTGKGTSVEVPSHIDGLTVYKVGNSCFNGNTVIKSVSMPACITEIGSFAFFNCTDLEDVTFPSNDLIIGDSAFRGCIKLNNLKFYGSNLIIKPAAFSGCQSLDTIKFAGKVNLTVGESAFRNTGITKKMMPYGAELDGDYIFSVTSAVKIRTTAVNNSKKTTAGTTDSGTSEDIIESVTDEYTETATADTESEVETENESETETTHHSVFREWFWFI